MDTFGDGDFAVLAIMVWLLIAARVIQLLLVPSLLLAAAFRLRISAPRWISRLLIAVACGLFASYAISLLTFHAVQQWMYGFSADQHGKLALITSVVNYASSIAVAFIVVGLARSLKKSRAE